MSRRRKIFVAVLCGVVACVLVVVATHRREPSFKGKLLSEHVAFLSLSGDAYPVFDRETGWTTNRDAAVEAIKAIGGDAVPALLAWTNYEPPWWRKKFGAKIQTLPRWVAKLPGGTSLLTDPAPDRAMRSARAFGILGSNAVSAIPELAHRLRAKNSPSRVRFAVQSLVFVGPPAVPTLLDAMDDPYVAFFVAMCAGDLAKNALPVVPRLIRNLQHSDVNLAEASAQALGELRLQPDLVVPALVKCLDDPRESVRFWAVYALDKYSSSGQRTVPALKRALKDSSLKVRKEAKSALENIAIEGMSGRQF